MYVDVELWCWTLIDLSFLRLFCFDYFKIDLIMYKLLGCRSIAWSKSIRVKKNQSFFFHQKKSGKIKARWNKRRYPVPSTIKTIQVKPILLDKYKYVVTRYFFDQQINTQVKQYNQQKKINKKNRYKDPKIRELQFFFFYYRKRRINYKINLQFYTYTSLRVRPGGNDWDNFSALSESSTVKVYKYLEHLILNFVHFLRLAILTDLASLRRAIRRKSRISVICLGC